jgi:hypothetical protein
MNAYDVGDKATLKGRFGTNQTALLLESRASSTGITVASVAGYATGDVVLLNAGTDTEEMNTVNTITGRELGMTSAWIHPHHIREPLWERTDPTTVSLKVRGPSGSTASYTYGEATVSKESVGIYSKSVSLSSAGTYYYRWQGTGDAETAGEGQFTVRPSQFAT